MTAQLWIALGFLALLVIYIIIDDFRGGAKNSSQHNNSRFIKALCAGFAGGFIIGEALFKLNADIGTGGTIAVSGTGGAALFFTIWFTYPKWEPILKDEINFVIPPGNTFEQAVLSISEIVGQPVKLEGFSPENLTEKMPKIVITGAKKVSQALSMIKNYYPGSLSYNVNYNEEEGFYHLKKS